MRTRITSAAFGNILPAAWLVVCLGLWFDAGTALAADGTWTNTGSGAWSELFRWQDNIAASDANCLASFRANITADRIVTNDLPGLVIGHLRMEDTSAGNSWTLQGQALTLASTTGTPSITSVNGAQNIKLILDGANGLEYRGPGTVRLSTNMTYTGGTVVDGATIGLDNFTNAFSTGVLSLKSGNMFTYGSTVTVTLGNDVTLDGDFNFGGDGTSAGGAQIFSRPAILSGNRTVTRQNYTTTFSGGIGESVPGCALTIVRYANQYNSGGTIGLGSANTYSGPTVVNGTKAFTATLQISGSLNSTPSINVNVGGRLDAYMGQDDRIANSIPITLRGGTLSASGYQGSWGYTRYETFGSVVVPVSLKPGQATIATADYRGITTNRIAAYSRDRATVLFSRSEGTDSRGGGRIILAGQPDGFIGGWAIALNGGVLSDANRYDFATYNSITGVTVMAAVGRPTDIETAGAGDHVRITNSTVQVLTASRTISSLALAQTNAVTITVNAPDQLTIASGGVLVTDIRADKGNTTTTDDRAPLDFRIAGSGSLTTPSDELVLHIEKTHQYQTGGSTWFTMYSLLTIDTPIVDGTGGAVTLIKSGSGTLKLTATNTFTGGIFVNFGTLMLTNVNRTAGTVAVAAGATLAVQTTNALNDQMTLALWQAAAPRGYNNTYEGYSEVNLATNATVRLLSTNGAYLAAGTYNSASLPGFLTGARSLTVLASAPPDPAKGTLILLR